MRAQKTIAALAVITMSMAGTAFAQTSDSQAPADSASTSAASSASADTSADQQKSTQMLASNIIGMPVKNGTGDDAQDIGKITDLVLNREQKTVNVLVGVGGFLGIGTKEVGVPLNEVKFNPSTKTAVVAMSKEALEKAPAYVTLEEKQAKTEQTQQNAKMKQQQTQPPSSPLGAPAAPAPGGATK
ncbi:PRC-barrel domain-containing protein [Castellaniella sp.]|uniref:PRC-barrel domain-containing protein n=1 Tax=Castellaniella sp. TaxID=1955812 RepID=UPI003C75A778